MRLQTVAGLFDELDNAGTVMLRGVSKSYFYFRLGSPILRIEARSKYSIDNIANVLQGIVIHGEDGDIPVKKVIPAYLPKAVGYNAAMYPKSDMPFFEFEGSRYVNTYHDSFAAFEPSPDMLQRAKPYIEKFARFVKHITGHQDGDDAYLLDKLAWILQKPYRRLPTATIIYSHTRGSGKDVFMSLVRELVGRQYYMPIDLQSIESPHIMLHDKIVCTASEVQLQTNARGTIAAASFMGKLKDKVTAKNVYVDEKFVQPYSAPLFANFFLLSNFELSSILEPGDRRMDVFHAAEAKLDQEVFGDLADIGNDGIWLERTGQDSLFRKHVIYAIRRALLERQVDAHFDRQEAQMNSVKQELMQYQNPPAIEWMINNLPPHFTEDVAMMACFFCPMRVHPEYVMKQLKEHLGPAMLNVHRNGQIYRMNGAPKLETRSDAGKPQPVLNFMIDSGSRKAVYVFKNSTRDANPSDPSLRLELRKWYETMMAKFYGNTGTLPGNKPDVDKKSDLI
jgi:hypothetical protein